MLKRPAAMKQNNNSVSCSAVVLLLEGSNANRPPTLCLWLPAKLVFEIFEIFKV